MKSLAEIRSNRDIKIKSMDEMNSGFCHIKGLTVIFSNAYGWEHVSVSTQSRCPTWEEMSMLKDMFWDDSETVVQYHPKKSEYVNNFPYCLHLWKKNDTEYELPPRILVGI